MKAYIYTIRSHQTNQIYIGSTTQALSMRMCKHRANYKMWLNKNGSYTYISSYEIIKFPDNYIELLLEVEVESKLELRRLEGEQIRKLDCVNKNIAGQTKQEYNQENAVKIAEQKSDYYQKNIVKIAEYNANYQQENKVQLAEQASKRYTCECGSIVTTAHKVRHCKSQKHLKAIELKAITV